jgi:AcrR family transcriptional regulator
VSKHEPAHPPAARRDDILRIASELFAERGFNAVGMRAIADAVGMRSSSLYYHFPSKLDILHAIALSASRAFVEAQLPRLEGEGSHAQRLTELVYEHVLYFWEHRVEEAVALRELRELGPERAEEVNEDRRAYQRALVAFIEEGRDRGEFDVENPRIATMAVLNMINGVNEWFRDDGDLTIDEVAAAYADYAVQGILGARRSSSRRRSQRRAAA